MEDEEKEGDPEAVQNSDAEDPPPPPENNESSDPQEPVPEEPVPEEPLRKMKSPTPERISASPSKKSSAAVVSTADRPESLQAKGSSTAGSVKFSSDVLDKLPELTEVPSGTDSKQNTVPDHSVSIKSGSYRGVSTAETETREEKNKSPCPGGLFEIRSPFIHNPPEPEERRPHIECPRTPKEYIINLRENLADFQESHGLPRSRDYSFLSLGLALAQETGRAVFSLFQMFTELFPIIAIVSLIFRFALDKLIEILETTETASKLKKSFIFALEMIAILIPLWIIIGTIIIPLFTLVFSVFTRILRIKGGKKKILKIKPKPKQEVCGSR